MAITDNLITHVYAESGDSAMKDKIQDVTFSGTGTPTLSTVGSEDSWNLASFAQTGTVPSFTRGWSTQGGGCTFAVRYNIDTFGSTGTFNELWEAGLLRITKNAANLRHRWFGSGATTLTGAQTTATTHTLVCVLRCNRDATSSDYIETYKDQASRSTNDPDFVSGAFTGSGGEVTFLEIAAPDTMDYDLLDFCYWERELTDAEAASVADDLRTELPIVSGTTVTGTLAGIDVTAFAGTITAATVVTGTLASIDVTSFAGTVSQDAGITTEVLKNNTGTVLSSQSGIEVNIYSLTDGSLVLRKTGQTSDGSGVVSFSDPTLVAGTTYRVTITISTSDGVARIQAA